MGRKEYRLKIDKIKKALTTLLGKMISLEGKDFNRKARRRVHMQLPKLFPLANEK